MNIDIIIDSLLVQLHVLGAKIQQVNEFDRDPQSVILITIPADLRNETGRKINNAFNVRADREDAKIIYDFYFHDHDL
jgi:hypothetical protein